MSEVISESGCVGSTHDMVVPFEGMVAFFDILGYKQIARSGIAKNISDVIRILQAVRDSIKDGLKTKELASFGKIPYFENIVQSVLDSIETENISDSLVSTINFSTCKRFEFISTHGPSDSICFLPYVFILYCQRLNEALFKAGLPVRGAIEYGKIFKKERVLAGQPLVNAYSLSESLNCAGVVLTIATEAWLKSLPHLLHDQLIWQYFSLLHVPTKKGTFDLQYLRNPGLFNKKLPISDIRGFVCSSFSRYDKDVSPDVLDKMENTINLFRAEVDLRKRILASRPVGKMQL